MFAWYKRWQEARIEKRFKAAVQFLEQQRPEMFQQFIADRATELAGRILMDMLDKEGFRHCFMCPSRQQLQSFEGRFYCPPHAALMKSKSVLRTQPVNPAVPLKVLIALVALALTACHKNENRMHFAIDLPAGYEPIGREMKQDLYDAENTNEREYTTVISARPTDPAHKIYIATFILELKSRKP